MPKAKRVTGSRKAPNLPKLAPSDYEPWRIEAVKKVWNLKEAAFYVLDQPADTGLLDNPASMGKVGQYYLWLLTEWKSGRLPNAPVSADPPLFSPGAVMRYLWEQERSVSLRLWALYDQIDAGMWSGSVTSGISKHNYILAATIVNKHFPKVTKGEIIRFLQTLPKRLKSQSGVPYFTGLSDETLQTVIRNVKNSRGGRPKTDEIQSFTEHEDFLIEEIRKVLHA